MIQTFCPHVPSHTHPHTTHTTRNITQLTKKNRQRTPKTSAHTKQNKTKQSTPRKTPSVCSQSRHSDAHVLVNRNDLLLVRCELIGRPLEASKHHVRAGSQAKASAALLDRFS